VSTTVAPTGSGIGTSARRVDGIPKVTGEYAYGSDLDAENRTRRRGSARSTSPRPAAGTASRPC
jgi:hypothetical protein